MDSTRPRVLVIRGGAIGDFILTLPAIRLLRQSIPHAHLEVMGYSGIADLAVKAGIADATRPLGDLRMAQFYAKNAQIDPALADDMRSFNLIVSYLFDPDAILRENMEKLGVKTLIECPHRVIVGQGHASQQLARPLERLAMFLEEPTWREPLLCKTKPQATTKRIAIHPGSGSLTKNWPALGWQKLAEEIHAAHPEMEIVFISGEAEAERGTLPQDLPFTRWHGLPLTQLADHITTCDLFLGHDSGISHLASTCGVPCLLLFGPTDPATWAPPQPSVRVIRAPGGDLNKLPFEAVRDTAFALIG
jgi:ADP-heptose:LPS heptosyltransferase